MLDKSILFPQDKDSKVFKQFYASKIKNIDLKTCFNLLKTFKKIKIFMSTRTYVLQSSCYAKLESIKDVEENIQIKNMNVALNKIWSTIKQIEEDTCLQTILGSQLLEIPNDLSQKNEL